MNETFRIVHLNFWHADSRLFVVYRKYTFWEVISALLKLKKMNGRVREKLSAVYIQTLKIDLFHFSCHLPFFPHSMTTREQASAREAIKQESIRLSNNNNNGNNEYILHSHRFNWHICMYYMCTSLITILFSFTTSSALAVSRCRTDRNMSKLNDTTLTRNVRQDKTIIHLIWYTHTHMHTSYARQIML